MMTTTTMWTAMMMMTMTTMNDLVDYEELVTVAFSKLDLSIGT